MHGKISGFVNITLLAKIALNPSGSFVVSCSYRSPLPFHTLARPGNRFKSSGLVQQIVEHIMQHVVSPPSLLQLSED